MALVLVNVVLVDVVLVVVVRVEVVVVVVGAQSGGGPWNPTHVYDVD